MSNFSSYNLENMQRIWSSRICITSADMTFGIDDIAHRMSILTNFSIITPKIVFYCLARKCGSKPDHVWYQIKALKIVL